jgi:hypothetical protein
LQGLLDLHKSFIDNDLMFHTVKDEYHTYVGSRWIHCRLEQSDGRASARRTAEAPAIRA